MVPKIAATRNVRVIKELRFGLDPSLSANHFFCGSGTWYPAAGAYCQALRRWLRRGAKPAVLIEMAKHFHGAERAVRQALEIVL